MVSLEFKEWEKYQYSVKELLQALYYTYKRLKLLEPTKEQKPTISFDEYMKKELLVYDSEEFERVRDKFERQHTLPVIEDIER